MDYAETPTSSARTMAGWAGAAQVVHRGQQISNPPLIELEPAGQPPIVLDLASGFYVWENSLRQFPAAPSGVLVRVHPPSSPRLEPGSRARSIDAVLWMIGLHAFPDSLATWLSPDDKYQLKQVPDLANLLHTPRHALAMKRLTRGPMTLDKLVATPGIDATAALQVVNGLSLAGSLRRIESRTQRRQFG